MSVLLTSLIVSVSSSSSSNNSCKLICRPFPADVTCKSCAVSTGTYNTVNGPDRVDQSLVVLSQWLWRIQSYSCCEARSEIAWWRPPSSLSRKVSLSHAIISANEVMCLPRFIGWLVGWLSTGLLGKLRTDFCEIFGKCTRLRTWGNQLDFGPIWGIFYLSWQCKIGIVSTYMLILTAPLHCKSESSSSSSSSSFL